MLTPTPRTVSAVPGRPHRVVVVGGGFGGLQVVRGLRRAPVEVTRVDRSNFRLFQPLLYQVATGALASDEIASPLRGILKRQRNARVVLGEVTGVDMLRRRLVIGGRAWLTFVVAGAGPTGVELAGQIAEIARDTLRRQFRRIDPRDAHVVLADAADRVLPEFAPELSSRAEAALRRLGITPLPGRAVGDVDRSSVTLEAADGAREEIAARTVVWAAGVRASALAAVLADATGASLDRAGRVAVGPDLTLPGRAAAHASSPAATGGRPPA